MPSSFAKEAWCIHTYAYVCIYVYVCIWECNTSYRPIYAELLCKRFLMYTYICIFVYICMYVYIWECTTGYRPIYAELFCERSLMYMHICTCVYVCLHICMGVHYSVSSYLCRDFFLKHACCLRGYVIVAIAH